MRIKAAVCPCAKHAFEIQDLEMRDPDVDEVKVRIVATGVCHTDMVVRDQIMSYPLPGVLGHEGAGIVEYVGPSVQKSIAVGDHVILTMSSCGVCRNCVQGRPVYCLEFYPLNFSGKQSAGSEEILRDDKGVVHSRFFGQSSFASYTLVKERNVVVIPKDVPLEIMGPLGCGFQTGAGAVMNTLKPTPGSSIAVFGAGGVGLAGVMAANAMGCGVIISVDTHQNRLDMAKQLGATHVVNGKETDSVAAIRKIMKDQSAPGAPEDAIGVDFSLDSTGAVVCSRQAMDVLAYCGACALVGAASDTAEIAMPAKHMLMGRSVCGVTEGESVPDVFLPHLISLWRKGMFPFDKLVKIYPFDQINQAVDDSEKGVVIKAIIKQPELPVAPGKSAPTSIGKPQ